MLIDHTNPAARRMIVVDPVTGLQIEHVKAVHIDQGWVETWRTYEAHPDYKSVWLQDGKTVEKDFMLLRMTNGCGETTYMSRIDYRAYDVVDKFTGEVLHEVIPKPSPAFVGEFSSEESPEPEPSSARTF